MKMRSSIRTLMLTCVIASGGAAFAQNPLATDQPREAAALPPEAKPATDVVVKYLDAVKARRWAEAKKLTHPRTLEAIAQRKKRLGNEDHPMAPWFYEKTQYYLKEYRLMDARPGPLGTWIVETSEDNFQVEEKGIAEGDMATYLVGRLGGKWVVVDKKRGVTFPDDSVKIGYRGYFDKVEQKAEGAEE